MAFKMKGFEPHNMYKTRKANTKADHDRLEKQSYDHSPYNKGRKKVVKKEAVPTKRKQNTKMIVRERNVDGSVFKKAKGMDGKACWKGYKLQGTKKKGGRTVDNCVKM